MFWGGHVNRREFTALSGGALCGASLATRALAAEDVSARARTLYARALVLDCNSAPPFEGEHPLTQAQLDMVRGSGIDILKWTLGGINGDFAATVAEIGQVQLLIEHHPEYFMAVRTAADLKRAKPERRLGIILSFESADMHGGKLESLSVFRDLGVRVMQLSYNRKSPFAAGVMEPQGGGLTALGREAVAKMNAVGVAVDLSHANAQTTSDAIAASSKPVLMTHAGCTAVHAH